jgi:acyl-coenzyme A synthetase/AMP-(fatty) acid ligase
MIDTIVGSDHHVNIVDPVLFQCRSHPPAASMCVPGASLNLVSYGRLEQFIANVCRTAQSMKMQRGETVAIFVQHPILHASIILGLTRLGIVTLSGRNPDLPKELKIDAVITDAPHPFTGVGRILLADFSWIMGDGRPVTAPTVSAGSGDDICRIILTSGTTGDSKAVAFSHNMVAERIARHHSVFGNLLPLCSRTYCDMGFATSLGFQFLIYVLWRGGTLFFPGTSAESTLQAFQRYDVQNIVASPAGLASLTRVYEQIGPISSDIQMILSAGSLLPRPLSERTRACICSNLVSVYGSTETSVVATAPGHVIAEIPGGVGYVTPGMSVEIVDEAGASLPPDKEGRIRIRGPYSATGYVGDPETSATAFLDGWFYPGDMGVLTPQNLLVISGREKALMNLGGDKVKPELIEDVLMAFAGVDQAAAFGVTNQFGIDEAWAFIVPRATLDEKALRTHCEQKLPGTFVPVRFIVISELPRNQMGKIERSRLPEIAKAKLH